MIDIDRALGELWANTPVPKYAWYRGVEYMIGSRVYSGEQGGLVLALGSYGKDGNGVWWIRPPRGDAGPLTEHEVTEHDDGTITVSPSIDLIGVWHGFLEHGVWREA